jgi:hypothetical protein
MAAFFRLPPWALAIIVLLVSCVVGTYYVKGDIFKGLVPEGFFAGGSLASYTRRQAQLKCETDRAACVDNKTPNVICTDIYNRCTAAAAAANTDVSKVTNAPSDPGQAASSAAAAQTYAKGYGDKTFTGDKGTGNTMLLDEYQARRDLANAQAPYWKQSAAQTDAYKKLLASLATREVTEGGRGKKPTDAQLSLAQGDETGYSGAAQTTGNYVPSQQVIPPHVTPEQLKALITAKLASDRNTQAQTIQEDSMLTPSIRSQIRDDVRQAIRDEIADLNNEYEIQYD